MPALNRPTDPVSEVRNSTDRNCASSSMPTWSDPDERDPGETARQMLRLAWAGEIEKALEFWHPAADRALVSACLEAMAEAAAEQGTYVMLSMVDLVSFDAQPIGYDRYIVTPMLNGKLFDNATRLMVQRYGGKCAIPLRWSRPMLRLGRKK